MATLPPSKKARKFHHKSRYGCLPCKQRKIKCDEKKPVCGNCAQRQIYCSLRYLEPATSRQLTTTSNASNAPVHQIPAQTSHPGAGPPFCRSNTRDLELYVHFQAYTAASLAHQVPVGNLFRVEFPRLAASFPFVGHGLLSIAYVHLAGLSRSTSGSLFTEAAFHVNQALPGYLETIKDITEENSAALFGFAMFVVLFTFADVNEECAVLLEAARIEPTKKAETIRGLAGNAARVAHSIHNILGIFWRCQRWISSGPLAPAVQRYSAPMLSEPSMTWIRIEDGRLAMLRRLWEDDSSIPLSHSAALTDSLRCLRDTFAMVTQLTVLPPARHSRIDSPDMDLARIHGQLSAGRLDDVPSVFTWYIRLSPEFIGMIEEGNAYAMVVLAHYAIVLDRACSDKWWMHQLPRHFVAMAELALGHYRRNWIEWPLLVVADDKRAE
ncbi:hypothetical protein BDW62DRAFT_46245 [Aspergillus aurantiobrunneus]